MRGPRAIGRAATLAAIVTFCAGAAYFARGQGNTPDPAAQGRALYAGYCAGCHGRRLEGQALWRASLSGDHRRAPALDQTGNAWLRSDAMLLQIVKVGQGAMPAYRNTFDDAAIGTVLAFVKSRWPVSLRIGQALQNPAQTRLPTETPQMDWRFPGRCRPAH